MIDKILNELTSTDFDFRNYANSSDPLKNLFDEWVDYYKLKWTLSKIIQPKSILEIGVRYGYSAIAFLDATPTASYVGIDMDSDIHGGQIGAIDWAKNITSNYQADFLISDTQDMEKFPGSKYDLIHIHGQQDGDSTYRDLEKALLQGKYIVVDGFFWTNENFQSSSAFLRDNKNLIEYYFVIPGHTGELLIKVNNENVNAYKNTKSNKVSSSIREHYAFDYYLQDCGGFSEYKLHEGKKLVDPRLNAVFNIANVKHGHHIVDAGCGRGEMTYACATAGATIDAIDYSNSSILLAKKCFLNENELSTKVNFQCADITEFRASKQADRVIASDLIEHLAPHELDKLYENVANDLKEDGQFIIHTFPNLWFYQYGYSQKRRRAKAVGAYLSPQPRTFYERLMHINEQSPRILKHQLSKYFKHVIVWFGSTENPIGSLLHSYTHTDCKFSTDLFAIASHSLINIDEIISRFRQLPLNINERLNMKLDIDESNYEMISAETANIYVKVLNKNSFSVKSITPNPVHLSYHWIKNGEIITFDGRRTRFSEEIGSGETKIIKMPIDVPKNKGKYDLQIGLVQEGVAWFEQDDKNHLVTVNVNVV